MQVKLLHNKSQVNKNVYKLAILNLFQRLKANIILKIMYNPQNLQLNQHKSKMQNRKLNNSEK